MKKIITVLVIGMMVLSSCGKGKCARAKDRAMIAHDKYQDRIVIYVGNPTEENKNRVEEAKFNYNQMRKQEDRICN